MGKLCVKKNEDYKKENMPRMMPSTVIFHYSRPTSIVQNLGSHYTSAIWKKLGFSQKFRGCTIHKVALYMSIYGALWNTKVY